MGVIREKLEWADKLSLGISVVVAILMGVGIGFWLKSLFNQGWLVWLGTFWGVTAAFLNIKRAYQKVKKELDEEAEKYKEYRIYWKENFSKDKKDDEDMIKKYF